MCLCVRKNQIVPETWKQLTADAFVPAFLKRVVAHNSCLCRDEIRLWSGRGGRGMPVYNKRTSAVLRRIPPSSPVNDVSRPKFPDSPQTNEPNNPKIRFSTHTMQAKMNKLCKGLMWNWKGEIVSSHRSYVSWMSAVSHLLTHVRYYVRPVKWIVWNADVSAVTSAVTLHTVNWAVLKDLF